jgi:hypothetical protein
VRRAASAGIDHDGAERPALDAAALVDLGNREHDAFEHGPFGDRHDALLREEHTDPDRLAVLAHDRPPAAPLVVLYTLATARSRATPILAPLTMGGAGSSQIGVSASARCCRPSASLRIGVQMTALVYAFRL